MAELDQRGDANTMPIQAEYGARVSLEGFANSRHTVDGVEHAPRVIQGILNDASQDDH